MSDLRQMRVAELREKCDELGLSHDGLSKAELIEMLQPHVNSAGAGSETGSSNAPQTEGNVELEMMRLRVESERMQHELRLAEIQAETRRVELEKEENIEKARIQLEREVRLAQNAAQRQGPATHHRPDNLKELLPRLKEGDDVDAFLRTFEKVAKLHGWEKELWAGRLAPLLTGKAREAYSRLDDDVCGNYDVIKKAILLKYELTPDAYRQKFRRMNKRGDESYVEYGTRMRDAFDRWGEGVGAKGNVRKLEDMILQENLLDHVPPDLKLWLLDNHAADFGQLISLADEYTTTRRSLNHTYKGPRTDRGNSNNLPSGQAGKEKPKGQVQNSQNNRKDREAVKCYKCGKPGHIAPNCPNKQGGGPSDKGSGVAKGYLCRADQVDPKHKPYMSEADVNGKKIQLLRDTGATQTLVRPEYVHANAYTGQSVRIGGVTGNEVDVPLALIHLVSEPYSISGYVVVGVIDTLSVDMILGNELLNDRLQELQLQDPVMVVTRGQQAKMAEQETGKNEGGRPQNDKDVGSDRCATPSLLMLSKSELGKDQREDGTLKLVREKALPSDTDAGDECYFYWEGGILFRHWRKKGATQGQEFRQVVVPKQYRRELLGMAHDNLMAGHLGVEKTKDRILRNYYWPGLFRDVSEYIRTCEPCQKTSSKRGGKVPMVQVPIIGEPFQRIALDIVGPLPKSKKGNMYILVICDYSTRYPEAIPLRSTNADKIADELIKLFSRVGVPQEILTDQGSNFMSKLMVQVCESLGIRKIRTSPYHPQSNGLVERFNSTLKGMLKPYMDEGKCNWDEHLPYVLFAYREVPQESTGFSPFELLYGHRVRGPLDVLKETLTGEITEGEGILSYVMNMRTRLAENLELAHKNLSAAQTRQKLWYDKGARARMLEVGDEVLVLLPTSSSKLLAKWQGPYRIVQKVSDVDYVVEVGERKRHQVFHINMLKKWNARQGVVMYTQPRIVEEETDPSIPVAPLISPGADSESEVEISNRLSEEQANDVRAITSEFRETLSSIPGRTNILQHEVETTSERPVRQRAYRLPHSVKETVKRELDEMLKMGIIQESASPYASPIVLVTKKDQSMRLCVDYRKLNEITVFDSYPIPNIEELIDRLGNAKYVSTLDLTKGYYQVELTEAARKKSAFITPFGLYEFTVMPFGMKGAPATFQRLVDKVLRGAQAYAAAYIDDIVIFSETWEEHVEHLKDVLGRLREAGLTAKPAKCKFGEREVLYLGFVIGGGKVKPEPAKIEAVVSYPRPVTKTDVRAFLGLTGYYRKFIPEYSEIASPLTDLTRKSEPKLVRWNPKCEAAFQTLKSSLTSAPVLRSPNYSAPFIVQVDASDRGIGAVLSQTDEEGVDHPVAFISRKLLPREVNYPIIEKECLAIIWSVEKFHPYLFGQSFVIQTDHNPLSWLKQLKTKNARLMRWSLALQSYPMVVEHRSGRMNGNADALSRI
ncbi:uncharacterized protein [Diadema setosum]|uniref:uncharacterized protein n=1 Tax=Diadema setosum TaxID=31175 RepID=UPI003B3A72A9